MTENDKEYRDFQKAISTLEKRDFIVKLTGSNLKIIGTHKSTGTHSTGGAIDYLCAKYNAHYFG